MQIKTTKHRSERYNVSRRNIPYAEAFRNDKRNERMMLRIDEA
jgi:hypothetical protein